MQTLKITYPTIRVHQANLTISDEQAKALVFMTKSDRNAFVMDQLKTLRDTGHPVPHILSWDLDIKLEWTAPSIINHAEAQANPD